VEKIEKLFHVSIYFCLCLVKGTVQNLDSGLDHGLNCGLNNGLDIWTRNLIARGQRSRQITQQQCWDVTLCHELIICRLQR